MTPPATATPPPTRHADPDSHRHGHPPNEQQVAAASDAGHDAGHPTGYGRQVLHAADGLALEHDFLYGALHPGQRGGRGHRGYLFRRFGNRRSGNPGTNLVAGSVFLDGNAVPAAQIEQVAGSAQPGWCYNLLSSPGRPPASTH